MLRQADSLGISGSSAAAPAAFPAWARPKNPPESEAEAAFLAGAALARLDAIVRQNPPWAGVWRRRLALSAAAGVLGVPHDEALEEALEAAEACAASARPAPFAGVRAFAHARRLLASGAG